MFQPSPSRCQEVQWASTKQINLNRQNVVTLLRFPLPLQGWSVTYKNSFPTSLRCQKVLHHSGTCYQDSCWLINALIKPSFQFSGLWIEVESLEGQRSKSLSLVAFFRFANVYHLPVDLFHHKYKKISREWPSELKSLATGFSRHPCLISDWWPFIHVWSVFLGFSNIRTVSCILNTQSLTQY